MSFDRAVDLLNKLASITLAILTGITVVVVFGQVIFRFLLAAPLVWSEEVARFCLVWITFLGASLAVRSRSLIGVEALVRKLPRAWRVRVEVLALLLSVLFFAVIVFYGARITLIVAGQRAAVTGISMAWVYAAAPVGGLLMLLNAAVYLVEYLKEASRMG